MRHRNGLARRLLAITGAATAAVLGLGQATAAHSSGTQSGPGKVPDPRNPGKLAPTPEEMPTPEAKEGVALLEVVSGLGARLTKEFPDTYAGISSTIENDFTIYTVGDSREIEAYVTSAIAGVSTGIVPLPQIKYERSSVPEAKLADLERQIVADIGYWRDKAVNFVSGGLDARKNALTLVTRNPMPVDERAEFENRYLLDESLRSGDHIIYQVDGGSGPHYASRAADTPPWNAGDILTGGSHQCTSGFGVHNNAGQRFLLYAGHCSNGGSDTWRNNGVTVGTDVFNFFAPVGYDASIIPTSSSRLYWKQAGTREAISGHFNPTVGQSVCNEGAFSLEECGVVSATNTFFSDGVDLSQGMFAMAGAFVLDGDSGGPGVLTSIYGYLSAGIISAFDTIGGLSVVYDTGIDIFRFLYQVEPNT